MAGETMNVLVSGDAILDHHIYEGQEPQAMSRIRYGTRQITTGGGAELLFKLLQECRVRVAAASAESRANSPPLNYEPVFGLLELSKCGTAAIENLHLNGYGLYSPFPAFQEASLAERATPKKAAHHVWRLKQSLGYGARDPQRSLTPLAKTDAIRADHQVWLFDDGGLDFRFPRSKSAWPASLQDSPSSASALPEWIVLKTSAPLASGDLWYALTADNLWIERLLVVVSVADLRREPVVVSSGASWERTALDLVQALRANPSLQPLRRCRCLLVMFGVEGALLADCRQGEPRCHLIYDARHLEGDWSGSIEGDVFGRMSCFVTGIVSWLPAKRSRVDVEPNAEITTLLDGARAGLAAARRLVACGHGDIKAAPRLPLGEVADEILSPTITFCHAEVPKDAVPGLSGGTIWRILEAGIDNDTNRLARTLGQAQLVAQFGLQTLPNVPQLKLGKLRTIDRDEIERLRNIRSLIENYRDTPRVKRPLSIGVFGQPGSGKSFAVKELAKAVLGDDVPILEFNLSQFPADDPSALTGAFHQIRDRALWGAVPVFFWDEFDCNELQWLAKLLAPMQDGVFLEGQLLHPVGKCVFIFAGGTSYDFENFGPPEGLSLANDAARVYAERLQEFKAAKGPDFKSRLFAYLNVAGPNQRKTWSWADDRYEEDPADTGYPLRRALLLRSQLALADDQTLDIDAALLAALLGVSAYRHGARSLERIVERLKSESRGGKLRLSHLPPDEILNLHVDGGQFRARIERDFKFQQIAEKIAPYIHWSYLDDAKKHGRSVAEAVHVEFQCLSPEYQQDNLAAARRMPAVLAVAGLTLIEDAASPGVSAEGRAQIDVLAEAEHNGWMEQKLRNGWRYNANRVDSLKFHNCLLPFAQLPPHQQDKDRDQVRRYSDFAAAAGYRIDFANTTPS